MLAILPATMELVELVVHWAAYGDLADAAGDTHGTSPMGEDEHGCSGTLHFCSCHAGQTAQSPARLLTTTSVPRMAATTGLPPVVSLLGLLPAMPDLRPPIA